MINLLGTSITNAGRRIICTFCLVYNGIVMILCTILLCRILYISQIIPSEKELIPRLDAWWIPIIIAMLCSLRIFHGLAAGKTWSEVCANSTRIQEEVRNWVRPVLVFHIIFMILFVATGILTYAHMETRESVEENITQALGKYKTQHSLKVDIDWMQINFECCGGNDYKDWFEVEWIDDQYKEGEDDSKDHTPFSCCNMWKPRPCIHILVTNEEKNENYKPEADLTLHRDGCGEKMDKFLDSFHLMIIITMLIMACLELLLLPLGRIAQTSYRDALKTDPEDKGYYDVGFGYVCKCGKIK